MPITDSILYKSHRDNSSVFNCCEELNDDEISYNGIVPMKYFLNHRDITNQYIKWLEILKNKLNIELEYELFERDVYGWATFDDFKSIVDPILDNYHTDPNIRTTYRNLSTHQGVHVRAKQTQFGEEEGVLYMGTYLGWLLFLINRDDGDELYQKENLKRYTIPFMDVRFPHDESMMVYFRWFFVRLYAEEQVVCNFLIDNEDEIDELVHKYKSSWYNALIYADRFINNYHIFCERIPEEVITYEKILKLYPGYCTFYDLFYSNFGEISGLTTKVRYVDNTRGRLTEKQSKTVLLELKQILQKLCTQ